MASRGAGPVVQGPRGMSAAGREAKRSAFGHAAAKARRTRLAISTTRAAILMSLRRSVANSAFARSRDLGMALRTASISQKAAVWRTRRTWLAQADRQDVRSEASWALCSLMRFSACPRAQ